MFANHMPNRPFHEILDPCGERDRSRVAGLAFRIDRHLVLLTLRVRAGHQIRRLMPPGAACQRACQPGARRRDQGDSPAWSSSR